MPHLSLEFCCFSPWETDSNSSTYHQNDGDVPVEGGNWQAKPHGTYSPRVSSGALDYLTGAQFYLLPGRLLKMVFIRNWFPAQYSLSENFYPPEISSVVQELSNTL